MSELKGIISVLITPFTADDKVDTAGLEKNIAYQLKNGIHAILVNGSTGEYASLTQEERYLVAETAVAAVGGEIPVAVGVTSESTAATIAYAQHAEKIGASAAMLTPSPYCKPDYPMIRAHFEKVCASISIPVILYNNPFTTGVDISLDQEIELLNVIPNLKYIKDSTGQLQRSRDIVINKPEGTNALCGWEDLALECLFVGCAGWISVIANVAPALSVSLYENAVKGDWAAAKTDYAALLPYLKFLEDGGCLVQATKYGNDLIGNAGGPNRAPRLDLGDSQKELIKGFVKGLGLI